MPHHQTRPPAGQRPVPGRPTPSHKAAEVSGRIAEAIAAFVLRLSGYRILARRWRCSAGELDIVARRGSTLAFVEVKYRHRQTQWYGLAQKQKNASHAQRPCLSATVKSHADLSVVLTSSLYRQTQRHGQNGGCTLKMLGLMTTDPG